MFKKLAKAMYARLYGSPGFSKFIARHYHRAYFQSDDTYLKTYWLGVPLLKIPFDLWMYQEILYEVKPDLVIETGTAYGGSALYIASIMDLIGHGEVVTVDIEHREKRPQHPRVTYLTSSSTDPKIVADMQRRAAGKKTVLVALDSAHTEEHVRNELAAYHSLVTEGSYLIVEDTHMGHPVPPFSQTGPMEAVVGFLKTNQDFVVDSYRERNMVSFNYNGYLKRLPKRK